jgi:hypothetical protein
MGWWGVMHGGGGGGSLCYHPDHWACEVLVYHLWSRSVWPTRVRKPSRDGCLCSIPNRKVVDLMRRCLSNVHSLHVYLLTSRCILTARNDATHSGRDPHQRQEVNWLSASGALHGHCSESFKLLLTRGSYRTQTIECKIRYTLYERNTDSDRS